MHGRIRIIGALAAMLLLVALLVPLSILLEQGKQGNGLDRMQRRIGDMHVRHAARMDREPGTTVEMLMELEDAWAIEDARQEAVSSLITEMHNGADELGFDSASQTFYCTLGSGLEEWPQFSLTFWGEPGVRVAWIDDYSYDLCADAVREGYRYELLAYSDTEFAYFGIVFTGLPIVTLHVDDPEELGEEYIPARAAVSGGGYDAIDTAALVHLRGGGFDKGIDKPNYRLEFHRLSEKGKDKKSDLKVLDLESDSDWLLIGNAGDESCVRNALGFDMWNKWNEGENAFALLDSRMVEVFVQDEYMGLFQLLPRIDEKDELDDAGGSLDTDVTARLIGMRFETGRPVSTISLPIGGCLELRQAPKWMADENAFAIFEDYVRLNLPEGHEDYLSDEEFTELALRRVDVREIMSYYLYMNACSLPYDNVKNNVYIWALKGEAGYTYTLSPWDMDSGFNPLQQDGTDAINMWMTLPVRMLGLDAGGCREILWEIYYQKRETILSDDAIYQWIAQMEDAINASGAYLRETERWRGGAQTLNLAGVSAYTTSQMYTIERHMQEVWPVDDGTDAASE